MTIRAFAFCLAAVLAAGSASAQSEVSWVMSAQGFMRPPLGKFWAPRSRASTPARPSLHFNGKNDGYIIPLNPVAGWKSFTVEALIRPDPHRTGRATFSAHRRRHRRPDHPRNPSGRGRQLVAGHLFARTQSTSHAAGSHAQPITSGA